MEVAKLAPRGHGMEPRSAMVLCWIITVGLAEVAYLGAPWLVAVPAILAAVVVPTVIGGSASGRVWSGLFLLSAASAWQSITTGVKPCTFFTVNSRPYHPVPRSDALGPRCRLIFGRRVHSVVMLCALRQVTSRPDSGTTPAPVCMAGPVRVSW